MQKKTVIVASAAVALLAGAVIWAGRGGSARVSTDTYAVEVAEGKEGKITAAAAPVTLTASDGSGLRLVSMSARASVHDPLAFTELRLVFENPEDRVREGTFRITLPQGASLSRFAMKVGSTWQEGEMVEKQAARRAYEDFLHRRQDPALLEQGGGNEFTARVFPIPAKGKKEIILSYSAELKESDPYTLALKGLPTLDELDISVRAEGTSDAVFGFKRGRFTPGADFIVDRKRIPRASALRAGDMMVARVVPMADQKKEPLGRTIVLFDTSASRALGLADSARALADLVAKLDADVTVILFDQTTDTVFSGKGATFGDQGVSAITRRGALGASNLEAAIASATELAKAKGAERLVVMSDGVPTAGETDPARLAGKLEALRAAGVKRVDAVAVGGIRDDGVLRKLTRGAMPSDGVVLGAELGAEEIARRLALGTTSKVPIKVEGASFWYPKTVDGLQPGDEVLVYAELTSQSPKVVVGDRPPQALSPRAAPRPLVERAFAQAKIASLYESGADANKAEIVRLSTSHRVLSPFTAMLVLETDADYRRFGIDRNANVDILTVEDGRVALKRSSRAGEADDDEQGGTGTRAKGEEGRMGRAQNGAAATATAAAPQTAPRDESAVAGPRGGVDVPTEQRPAPPAPGQARAEALREAAEFGMIGSLDTASPDPWGHGGAPAASAAATAAPLRAAPRAAPGDPLAGDFEDGNRGFGTGGGGRADQPGARARVVAPRPAPPPPPPPASRGLELASATATGGLSSPEAERALRGELARFRGCLANAVAADPNLTGSISLRFAVGVTGQVDSVEDAGSVLTDRAALDCVVRQARSVHFPAPSNGAKVAARFQLHPGGLGAGPIAGPAPYEGKFARVMERLERGEKEEALTDARAWRDSTPGDVLALVALGEVYEARGDKTQAGRAYGSIVDLFGFRADSRRFAGARLERLGDSAAMSLAADAFGKAEEQRPDHPSSHRMYAFALLRSGQHEKAFEVARVGASRSYPAGRFRGVDRILKEDLGLIAAAWIKAEPARKKEIEDRLTQAGGSLENAPSLRFVLAWETDANDVDFHIHDGKGGHAFYSQPELPSGGSLYADVTTGYGPECFTIRLPEAQRSYPYRLEAHYYSRGPMGYGMGKLEIIDHDGKGGLTFEERPFVVMVDRAFVQLGTVERPKK